MAAASGATGDIRNNLTKLLREIQRMKLRLQPDIQGLGLGAPSALLPILHHSLMHYSLPLASWLARHDYDLYCKNDLRFVEGVYKVLREVFGYHPRLTKEQFLTVGYAERKLQLVTELLRACQRKHQSLTGSQQRGRGRTRGGRHGRQTSDLLSTQSGSKFEVLTVQTTSGISSAWTESLVTRVQAGQETMSSLPHYSPPPHRLTPIKMLELTPSPPSSPPPPPHHLPTSPQSQPIVIRHETPPTDTESEEVHNEDFDSRETLSGQPPLEKLVVDSLSSSSEGGSYEERGEEREGEKGGHPVGGERGNKSGGEETGHTPQQEEVLVEVNQRVEQLAGMMERMSARFVLLETQLKTIQTRPSDAGRKESKEGDTEREEERMETPDLSQEEETRQEDAPLVTPVVKGTAITTVTEMSSMKARAALADLSNPRPLSGRETSRSRHHSSTPLTRHTVTPVARRLSGRGGALSSQLARIRAEGRLSPLPSPPHTSTPPPPSSPDVFSPSPSSISTLTTAASPDETTRLIANLRARAQRTKEFLQKANHRL